MCGRYTLTSAPEANRALFHYQEQPNFPARYNIAPTQPIANRAPDGRQAAVRAGALGPFALVGEGPQDLRAADQRPRRNGVPEKPAFRAAMKRRRCLIPADGFYEWQKAGDRKRPFYVRGKKGGPLAYAGLWESWQGPNGEELESAAIVTTRANGTLCPHPRAHAGGGAAGGLRPVARLQRHVDAEDQSGADCATPARMCSKPTRYRPRSTASPTTIRALIEPAGDAACPSRRNRRRKSGRVEARRGRRRVTGGQGALF